MGYNTKNYTERGGDKTVIGGELAVTVEGKITFDGTELKPAAVQADSAATEVAGLVVDFNALLAKLKTAGLMASE
ncbi:Head fiber protein [Clostridia bacterium]|nr:Head fiber protein [Clostridia bacterium]